MACDQSYRLRHVATVAQTTRSYQNHRDRADLIRIRLRVLANQDKAIDRKGPFVGVFGLSAAGQATFLRGTGIRHLDFVLTASGADGWMLHLIGWRCAAVGDDVITDAGGEDFPDLAAT